MNTLPAVSNDPAAEYFMPDREWVDTLAVGDLAPNPFGQMAEVAEITAIGDDIHGRRFVCYYTFCSPTSRISNSQKEGKLHRSLPLCHRHTSHELDTIERRAGGRR